MSDTLSAVLADGFWKIDIENALLFDICPSFDSYRVCVASLYRGDIMELNFNHNALYLVGTPHPSCLLDPIRMSILVKALKRSRELNESIVILTERIQDLVKLQGDHLNGKGIFKDITDVKPCFLEGHAGLKREGQEWTDAVSSCRPLFTTNISLLHALLHGFINLKNITRLVLMDSVPDSLNNSPLCLLMECFFWPQFSSQQIFPIISGFIFVESGSVDGDVFKKHLWTSRLYHYYRTFGAVLFNSKDAPHLATLRTNISSKALLNINWVLDSTTSESNHVYDALNMKIEELSHLVSTQPSLRFTVVNSSSKYIASFLSYHVDNSKCALDDPEAEKLMSLISNRLQPNLLSPSSSNRHIRTNVGALLEPLTAMHIILRFCSSLPKGELSGTKVKELSIRTVPVRLVGCDKKPISECEESYYSCELILPGCIANFLECRIVGPPMQNRHEAQCEAAFMAGKLLLEKGLLDNHLLICDKLMEHMHETETDEELIGNVNLYDEDTFQLSNASDIPAMSELIPQSLQGCPAWKGTHVYVAEWEWGSPENSTSLPMFTRWLKANLNFMDTKTGPAGFGLVLREALPGNLPPIFIPTGSNEGSQLLLENGMAAQQQGFVCNLRKLDIVLSDDDHEKLLAMQSKLFSILNVRPLLLDELCKEDNLLDKPWIPDDKRTMYMIAPMIREEYSFQSFDIDRFHSIFNSIKNESSETAPSHSAGFNNRLWIIDWKFLERLNDTTVGTVSDILAKMEKYKDEPDFEIFSEYCLKQALFHTPYNGMVYRMRKLYTDFTPSSPFESKAIPEAKTFWEYTQSRYDLPVIDNIEEKITKTPMLGVNRVENFADICQWTLHGPDDDSFMTNRMQSDKKRLKRDDTSNDESSKHHRTALIPWLTYVCAVPYAAIRSLLLIPRIVGELEGSLLALDFYSTLALKGYIPQVPNNVSSLITSLTSATAFQPESYERMEVLGDSILKATVSIDVFVKHRNLGEGRLSSSRMAKISNSNLLRIGKSLFIHKYAKIASFSPKLWTPPALPIKPSEENSNHMDWAQKQRLFDPETKWRLLENLEKKRVSRETVYDFDVNTRNMILPKVSSSTGSTITRLGQPFSAKTIADLVEASIGAIYETCGWSVCLQYVHKLGLIDNAFAVENTIHPLDLLGNMVGDPRDRMALKPVAQDWSRPLTCKYADAANDTNTLNMATLDKVDYAGIEQAINFNFSHKELIFAAFTHVSTDSIYCNERLEWLGDALIDWTVTKFFYEKCPVAMSPFQLTEARKASVNNVALAELTVKYGLHRHMRIANRELTNDIARYLDDPQNVTPPKALGDQFEATIGAVFLDTNMSLEATDRLICTLMQHPRLSLYLHPDTIPVSAISRCLAAYARMSIGPADLRICFTPDHRTCQVIVLGKVVGEADICSKDGKSGRGKALAKERAAQAALDRLLAHGL